MKKLFGLVGETLSHSLSPQIHTYIFDQLGIDAGYFLFPVKKVDLFQTMEGLKLLGAKGINVTIPYKTEIMQFVDEISPEAKKIGAVNTISIDRRFTKGYNTDYEGFGWALKRHGIEVAGKTAIILGTGGAAKTVACYLADHGARDLHIVSRQSKEFATDYPVMSYQELSLSHGADLLVNCTPVGMYPNIGETPVESMILERFGAVFDLIYNPDETLLLADARRQGILACNGLTMLIGQAVLAEELWQNRKIDMAAMEPLVASIGKLFCNGPNDAHLPQID